MLLAGGDAGEMPKAPVLRDYPPRAACRRVVVLDVVELRVKVAGDGGLQLVVELGT